MGSRAHLFLEDVSEDGHSEKSGSEKALRGEEVFSNSREVVFGRELGKENKGRLVKARRRGGYLKGESSWSMDFFLNGTVGEVCEWFQAK